MHCLGWSMSLFANVRILIRGAGCQWEWFKALAAGRSDLYGYLEGAGWCASRMAACNCETVLAWFVGQRANTIKGVGKLRLNRRGLIWYSNQILPGGCG